MEFPLLETIHQLRSNHVRPNQFLFKCRIFSYPICNNLPEAVDHYLLSCKCYLKQHQTLRLQLKALKLRSANLTTQHLLQNPKAIIPVATYIRDSKRFTAFSSYTTKLGPAPV
ncbi:hypothetical protein Pst134EA_024515 [Puccinia striiformis f. sp. tritici]|uniref:hypothetical protein n=1 Tax=Puccinia striiformis f. sp. tritici TaxID=168172 RepID=UPI002007A1EA|nr:hypothetical protein Pst134EA_024515 [Puccinia striiformis f. sp. tritici]KAH9444927.1 hypothetical protein Pst134EB_025179 [Puccinia striiformis f. sp. tritici]KAH9453646.1 hypothetical protein Pst134EA_024515 [Puccinia striiformis f. sp. tritici]